MKRLPTLLNSSFCKLKQPRMISVLVEDIYQQLSIIMVLYVIFLYYSICHQMVKIGKVNL